MNVKSHLTLQSFSPISGLRHFVKGGKRRVEGKMKMGGKKAEARQLKRRTPNV